MIRSLPPLKKVRQRARRTERQTAAAAAAAAAAATAATGAAATAAAAAAAVACRLMARAGAGTRCNLSHCGWYSATGLQLAPADPLAWRTRVRELRVTVQPAGLKGLGVFAVQQQGQSVSLAVPQLGPYASAGRAWRLRAARHSQGEASSLAVQPLPRVLEQAASEATDFAASDHSGPDRWSRSVGLFLCWRAPQPEPASDAVRRLEAHVRLPAKRLALDRVQQVGPRR